MKFSFLNDFDSLKLKNIYNLNKKLNEFEFGVPYNPDKNDIENEDKYYKSLTPEEFEKYKMGVCWDYTRYYAHYFNENKLTHHEYIMVETKDGEFFNNHSFPTVLLEKIYICESAWKINKGIKEFKNLNELIDSYTNEYIKYNKNNRKVTHTDKIRVYEYVSDNPKMDHLNTEQFMNIVFNNKNLVVEKKIED